MSSNSLNHVMSHLRRCVYGENLFVFRKYFITDTKTILALHEICPNLMVRTP